MSRSGENRRAGLPARLALSMGWALAGLVGSATAQDGANPNQNPDPGRIAPLATGPDAIPVRPTIEPLRPLVPVAPPGANTPAVGVATTTEVAPGLPDDVQVVRFQGPEGTTLEVLGPAPEAAPVGDGKGLATVGMKVGVGYRLRLTNIPNRPGVELFPVIEVVGHLHRPAGADPAKYPIRVVFALEDIYDAADRVRLVTQVVYLEDPDQALPVRVGKDESPSVLLNPAEEPLKVASALGRVMAIVRLGARRPMPDEMGRPIGDGIARGGCPFTTSTGGPCALPCGPVCGSPPPAGKPWLPRDEYLCDGGDRDTPLHFGGDGGLRGIDPRDAFVSFRDEKRPRVLPTNTVCLYAPRFASVRTSIGLNESLSVTVLSAQESRERQSTSAAKQGPKKFNQQAAAETNRHRSRASGLASRVFAGESSELRVLSGYDNALHASGRVTVQAVDRLKGRQAIKGSTATTGPVSLRRGESPVLTGIIEGAGQTVVVLPARETVGVEVPPNKPGVAVIKQVSVGDAEPGDEVTFTIRYKNMGNTPLSAVSIVDSLMPRLEYVPGSSMGPAGTVFTSGENKAASLELRWDLPGALAPGVEGYVSFRAVVR